MKVRDRVTGDTTEAFTFDGLDEGSQLRARLAQAPSVPEGTEVVVGSYRLYLPQLNTLPDSTDEVETEIVQRYETLVWSDEDGRWEIYPPKLFEKYFEAVPDGEA
jgi:hypothetical protein